MGCGAGANLARIAEAFPETQLAGVDVNAAALAYAAEKLPKPVLKLGSVLKLPFPDKSLGTIICDAVLLYVRPEDINQALSEIDRVALRAVILVEWFDKDEQGVVKDYHFARNYTALLCGLGFNVEMRKIKEEEWPNSQAWQKHGYLFVANR